MSTARCPTWSSTTCSGTGWCSSKPSPAMDRSTRSAGKSFEICSRPPSAGLVFVTAFENRRTLAKYVADISWETEVWVAENPTHLIHFDGERFLGPYQD